MFLASHGINASYQTSGDGSLADVLASAVFDLDATQSASYPGTGTTWANLVTAPADGELQTAYNATGISAPPFVGTAGSPSAYFSPTTGDYWEIALTTFLKGLHKTTGGSDFWFAITVNSDGVLSTFSTLLATADTQNASAGEEGIYVFGSTSEQVFARQSGTAGIASTIIVPDTSMAAGWHLIIVSYSHSNNNWRVWFDTATASNVTQTFATSTADSNNMFGIGGIGGAVAVAADDYDWASVAGGNEYLDNTGAAAIIAALEARHARDYTP